MVKMEWEREEVWFIKVAPTDLFFFPACMTWSISELKGSKGNNSIEMSTVIVLLNESIRERYLTNSILDHERSKVFHIYSSLYVFFQLEVIFWVFR